MQQIVDLEGSHEYLELNIALLSVAIDSPSDLRRAAEEWRVGAPLLSDRGRKVSETYGVLRWAVPSGEPGHTFVLVGTDGRVKWVRDYGAPENGGLMNVPLAILLPELKRHASQQ